MICIATVSCIYESLSLVLVVVKVARAFNMDLTDVKSSLSKSEKRKSLAYAVKVIRNHWAITYLLVI